MIKIIKSERLELKPLSENDRDFFLNIIINPSVNITYMVSPFSNKDELIPIFEKLKNYSLDDNHFVYGIYLEDILIGWINETEINDKSIELGYVISPDYQNKGYMTEALQLSIKTLFKLGFNEVIAGFFVENNASRRVLEKVGMSKIDKEESIEYRGSTHKCLYYSKRVNR